MRTALLILIAFSAFAAAPKPAAPVNDAAVEAAIRAKFAKSKISTNNFKVTVKSGVALLDGKTDIPQHKGVATRLAKSGGAREVVNRIQDRRGRAAEALGPVEKGKGVEIEAEEYGAYQDGRRASAGQNCCCGSAASAEGRRAGAHASRAN